MLCEKCNKNIANVYLKNNINGNITENYLCSSCAGELYGQNYMNLFDNVDSDFNFKSDIFNMLNFNKTSLPSASSSSPAKTAKNNICPMCGSTFNDIIQSAKAGCAKCYETFKNEFEPNVIRIHGTARHTGKIPQNLNTQITAKRKIEELNIKLKKMIADQNFEEAAVIRDEIKKINSERQKG
ncbi:MAG: UvrB/UvrC motif-containing protein [Oscillospiraceae bacterium]|nr:UvrB/UvrC motif-containing protein [Oscillospiraceae bacterium]